MFHPFSTIRTAKHILAILGILLVPFFFLVLFSYIGNLNIATVLNDLSISLYRIFIALIFAVIFGWVLAVVFRRGKAANMALPVFDVLQSFPTSAALPIAVMYFGKSNGVVIFFLVFAIIWPIFFSVTSSLRQVRKDWEEAVTMSRISAWNYLKIFLIPVTLPGLITGIIIGLGDAWEGLVATEIIVGVNNGLGGFFSGASSNPSMTLLGVLVFLMIIFVINKIIWLPLLDWSHHLTEE